MGDVPSKLERNRLDVERQRQITNAQLQSHGQAQDQDQIQDQTQDQTQDQSQGQGQAATQQSNATMSRPTSPVSPTPSDGVDPVLLAQWPTMHEGSCSELSAAFGSDPTEFPSGPNSPDWDADGRSVYNPDKKEWRHGIRRGGGVRKPGGTAAPQGDTNPRNLSRKSTEQGISSKNNIS